MLEGRYGIVSLEGCILIFTTTNKQIVNSHTPSSKLNSSGFGEKNISERREKEKTDKDKGMSVTMILQH